MRDLWSELEYALELPDQRKGKNLEALLSQVGASGPTMSPDVAELEAVIMSELARLRASPLVIAAEKVRRASSLGKPGWSNYYLARAALTLGENAIALAALMAIPGGFFESRDLYWRQVHCWEMTAVAQFVTEDFPAAEEAVNKVVNALVERGDSDDLAPPIDLVSYLLTQDDRSRQHWARSALLLVATSINVDEWFSARTAQEIRDYIELHQPGTSQ